MSRNWLIKQADAVFTGETHSVNNPVTDIRIHNGIITEIGTNLTPLDCSNEALASETIVDAKGCVIYPAFCNTHHHLAQSVLKAVPTGLNQGLGEWLQSVPYRFWPKMPAELVYLAAKMGLIDMLRSGVSICADHHYLYHLHSSSAVEQAIWQAADELGIRLVLCRGGANIIGSHKGMRNMGIEPETLDVTLSRLQATKAHYHQDGGDAYRKLVVAPTSLIHSQTPDQLIELAAFAKQHQLKRHSHLLEVGFDEQQSQIKYGMSAIDYVESIGWLDEEVSFAHLVQSNDTGIAQLGQARCTMSHCSTSNLRLGSGIAPVLAMQQQGVNITIGVDGSASSENASMLQELNLAWLLHRGQGDATATSVDEIIRWGSQNGAEFFGFNSGSIAVGKNADLVLWDVSSLRYRGCHDLLVAPIVAGEPATIKNMFIAGKEVVNNGQVNNVDYEALGEQVTASLTALLKEI
ncbi:amidohydrolase [Marinomonas agarivorans]|nr:amidohydrolase [Marinomonas agarivorans]